MQDVEKAMKSRVHVVLSTDHSIVRQSDSEVRIIQTKSITAALVTLQRRTFPAEFLSLNTRLTKYKQA